MLERRLPARRRELVRALDQRVKALDVPRGDIIPLDEFPLAEVALPQSRVDLDRDLAPLRYGVRQMRRAAQIARIEVRYGPLGGDIGYGPRLADARIVQDHV